MHLQIGQEWFMGVWPWIGLGGAVVLALLLFTGRTLQADPHRNRWLDPTWIAWAATLGYLLHNVEEYGLDATSRSLGFIADISAIIGETPPWNLIIAVNLSMIWVAGPVLAQFSRKYPAVGLAMPTFMLVNALTHTGAFFATGRYGAGLVTAWAIFLPLAAWTFFGVCGKNGPLNRRQFAVMAAPSLLSHVGLFAGVLLFAADVLPTWALGPFELLVSLAVVLPALRLGSRSTSSRV